MKTKLFLMIVPSFFLISSCASDSGFNVEKVLRRGDLHIEKIGGNNCLAMLGLTDPDGKFCLISTTLTDREKRDLVIIRDLKVIVIKTTESQSNSKKIYQYYLSKILDSTDKTIFDASICRIHHIPMDFRTVEIKCGLDVNNQQYERMIKYFPNNGVLLAMDSGASSARFSAWICSKCRDQFKRELENSSFKMSH